MQLFQGFHSIRVGFSVLSYYLSHWGLSKFIFSDFALTLVMSCAKVKTLNVFKSHSSRIKSTFYCSMKSLTQNCFVLILCLTQRSAILTKLKVYIFLAEFEQ